jgi:hypothetical protein
MAFQVSPGINVSEIDLTASIPAVSVSTGAIAGAFKWGPANSITQITSETDLVSKFGAPDNSTANVFFTAASFLAYSNDLLVVRAVNTTSTLNATADANTLFANTVVLGNTTSNNRVVSTNNSSVGGVNVTVTGINTAFTTNFTVGDRIVIDGNNYTVTVITNNTSLNVNTAFTTSYDNVNYSRTRTEDAGGNASGFLITNEASYLNEYYENGVTAYANTFFVARYAGAKGNSLQISICPSEADFSGWTYSNLFDSAPGTSTYVSGKNGANDEMHIVVVDAGGLFTGTPNTVIEKFGYVSKAGDARTDDGSTNYYRDVLYNKSKYVYWGNHPSGTTPLGTTVTNWGDDALNTTFGASGVYTKRFGDGSDGTITAGSLNTAYDLFQDKENIDISLIIAADGHDKGAAVVNNLTDIAEGRKDCVAFISPTYEDLNETDPTTSVKNTALTLSRSSYTVHDSGWKQMYDKYNDRYRWVPLNGDIAGLCARTDRERDPWFSPAGFQRGAIKNVVKLFLNPNQTQRDVLYKAGVNPVVSLPGEGTLLFGDKTFANKPSAFDRINVRRLFIVLEKAISRAARASLFEFNDEFTRAQFVSLVEPFLRTVQGRRGIYDFRVVCDETNNTADIIDRNEFVGDIYIKPARSINFVQLNFVAVRTGVEFNEIVGKF